MIVYIGVKVPIEEIVASIEREFAEGKVHTTNLISFMQNHANYKEIHVLTDYRYRNPIVSIKDSYNIFYTMKIPLTPQEIEEGFS